MGTRKKAAEVPEETAAFQTPLPAGGVGPLAKYPVPAGATHWRVHEVSPDARIRGALSLQNDPEGQPITRYPISLVGDARWWDALKPGTQVRLVFSRYHGDQLKAQLGQGPVWTIPVGGERVAAPPPAAPAAPAAAPQPEASLFLFMRDLQREAKADADAQADRHLNALQAMLIAQANNQTKFYETMTAMFMGERGAERIDARRERDAERKAEAARIEAMRGVVREELANAADDEDDEDEEDEKTSKKTGDAIANAVASVGDAVTPLVRELGKRAAAAASK